MDYNPSENNETDKQITNEQVLEILGKPDGAIKPHSTQQVADKLGCTQQIAESKLRNLEGRDEVLKHDQDTQSVEWTPRRMRR